MSRVFSNLKNIFFVLALCSCLQVPPAPDSASVPANPTFNGEIKTIFDNHCNFCHGTPPDRGAPNNFVLDVYADSSEYIGAKTMAGSVAIQIKNGKMPPGGGLGANDQATILKWVTSGAHESPTASSSSSVSTTNSGSSTSSSSSSSSSSSTTGSAAVTGTYASKYKAIIQTNCIGCHSSSKADGGYDFSSLANVQNSASDMASAIEYGSMPRGNSNFVNTADGQALMNWLQAGNIN